MKRLVLFDIDGTLLSAQGAPRRAFTAAMLEVYGTAGPVATHRFDGKTDPQIARELLTAEGISAEQIDAGLAQLWRAYLRELRAALTAPSHRTLVYPGVSEVLHELERRNGEVLLGLLTGNIAEGAALKLASAEIRNDFRIGAFGSDCEQRDGLPSVAVRRAQELVGVEFSRREIVIIGDTPSDVTCGLALDVRSVAVATGRHSAEALARAGAHCVFDDLSDTATVLAAILA
jgi:phosphoglycolate phosphatase